MRPSHSEHRACLSSCYSGIQTIDQLLTRQTEGRLHEAVSTAKLKKMTRCMKLLENVSSFRLPRLFTGGLPCPPGNNSYVCHFKGKHSKLYIVVKLIQNVGFGKKYELLFFFNSTKENNKNDCENDLVPFNQINELIGYQNLADFFEIWPELSLDAVKPKCVRDF